VNTVTGRESRTVNLDDMNTTPGDYLVFLGQSHVMYAHVRADRWCTVTDAQIGRGWAGPNAAAALRSLLGLAGGGPAAWGRSGPRPHPYLQGGETTGSFSFTRVLPPSGN